MKLDTQKPGLYALFKPYKVALLKHLYAVTTPENDYGVSSGYLWKWLEVNAERLGIEKRSQASVINGMKDLVDQGILKFSETTGKGGYRRLYSVAMTHGEFEDHFNDELIGTLHSIFEGDWWRLP